MLLQNLAAAELRTESSNTLCNVEAQILTRWCGASYPPSTDQWARRTLEDVLPRNQSMRSSSPDGGGVEGALPHGGCRSQPSSSLIHSGWPTVAQWTPAAVVVGAEVLPTLCRMRCPTTAV
jgi:hypothetical protein